jgi:endonuclease/exonuclease/phosphatase (EEP) superfamily protein YafD
MKILIMVLGVLMIMATLVPFIKKEFWWIRVFDFPRLQILSIASIVFIAYLFVWNASDFWENFFLIILLSAILHQVSVIFPYTKLNKKQVILCQDPFESITFSLMVMNVLMDNRNSKKALEIIRKNDPDILIALETDLWWKEQFLPLEKTHPHHVLIPLDNTYGMLLYSKYELIDPEVHYILVEGVPSIHTGLKIEDAIIKLYAVHPEPPAPGHSEKSTNRDAELITIGKKTRNCEDPVIVAGDLNDVAWSYTTRLFTRFSELMDPRIGRGMFNTFNAKHKLMRWPLDHIFHSDHFQLNDIKRLEHFDSDHFPIYLRLCFKPDGRHKQDEPEADQEEEAFAKDKVQRAHNGS